MTAKDRKLAIVKAALPLFARKGFAETTTREIARIAKVSEPLLYKHFPSKEALYLAIQDYSCGSMDALTIRLRDLKPSTSTLVHIVYYLARIFVLGRPTGAIPWEMLHRLMLNSLLEDGAYARLAFKNRVKCFCSEIETSMAAALKSGDVVPGPISRHNGANFSHHLGAWIALIQLPKTPVFDYRVSREELLHQVVWFSLRGLGMTDKALAVHYNPEALALSFTELP